MGILTTLVLEPHDPSHRHADAQIRLDEVERRGYGIQAVRGAVGFGLPPVSVRWLEGAGDGAQYRGRRFVPRDFDIPLNIVGRNEADLRSHLARLSYTACCTYVRLWLLEETGEEWWIETVRTGGGTYTLGSEEHSLNELDTVLTLRAGMPFWTNASKKRLTLLGNGTGVDFDFFL